MENTKQNNTDEIAKLARALQRWREVARAHLSEFTFAVYQRGIDDEDFPATRHLRATEDLIQHARCSRCHAAVMSGDGALWRWTGSLWEHACAGGQAGHFVATTLQERLLAAIAFLQQHANNCSSGNDQHQCAQLVESLLPYLQK